MLTRRAVDYKTASYDHSVTLVNAIGSNRKVRAVKKCNPGLRVSREGTDRELGEEDRPHEDPDGAGASHA